MTRSKTLREIERRTSPALTANSAAVMISVMIAVAIVQVEGD